MKGVRIGCAMTGSFCSFEQALAAYRALAETGAELYPIMSEHAYETDTRFMRAINAREAFARICGRECMHTLTQVEPLGPKNLVDMLIVAPCTGNTMAKLASGIVDGPVLMAAKSCLRNARPVLIAPASNDALGLGARNLGALLTVKHIFFVPFAQDDCVNKPQSLVARFDLLPEAARRALKGEQLQPLLAVPEK